MGRPRRTKSWDSGARLHFAQRRKLRRVCGDFFAARGDILAFSGGSRQHSLALRRGEIANEVKTQKLQRAMRLMAIAVASTSCVAALSVGGATTPTARTFTPLATPAAYESLLAEAWRLAEALDH